MYKTITFTCETITPMFLAGADGKTPELRPPSIKGAMRFWWRALNANLVKEKNGGFDYSELKRQESVLFGGTDKAGRSKIIISLNEIEKFKSENISLTPHHSKEYVNGQKDFKAIKREGVFYSFTLIILYDDTIIRSVEIENIIKSMFYLGGIGKRSRRGFGSINIKGYNFDINDYNNLFDYQDNAPNYPFVKEVKLGKTSKDYRELLVDIGKSTHLFKNNSLGFAMNNNRLASPIYTSIIKNRNNEYQVVISKLNTVYPDNFIGEENSQQQYINYLTT